MRVLIYSVSAGAGDVRAAEALRAAFERGYSDVTVRHFDLLKLLPPSFKRSYAHGYLKVINSLPSMWGWLYNKADRLPQTTALVTVRKFMARLNRDAVYAHALQHKPDVIIATHFLPAEIFSSFAGQRRRGAPRLAVVITEYDVHRLWVHPHVTRYYTASEEIARALTERAVNADLIRATGIPCHPAYGELLDEPARQRSRRMLGLAQAPARTLLVTPCVCMGSGAPLAEVLSTVLKRAAPVTLLMVCGKNTKVRKALGATVRVPENCVARFYGAPGNLPDLMGISDLIVTRPGGLTTSECLARRLPMVLVTPGPGQEERNAEMLLENGCAVLARTPASLAYKLEALITDPQRLDRMREGCRRTGKPDAAREIAADVVDLVRSRKA